MEKISKRVLQEAKHMIETNETIREIAKRFSVSKSTVHKDLQERLKKLNLEMSIEVDKILKEQKN